MRNGSRVLLIAALVALSPAAALADCNDYISNFRNTIDRDMKAGKLNKGTHDQISEEVDRVDRVCRTDWQYRAMKALLSTQERYGYR